MMQHPESHTPRQADLLHMMSYDQGASSSIPLSCSTINVGNEWWFLQDNKILKRCTSTKVCGDRRQCIWPVDGETMTRSFLSQPVINSNVQKNPSNLANNHGHVPDMARYVSNFVWFCYQITNSYSSWTHVQEAFHLRQFLRGGAHHSSLQYGKRSADQGQGALDQLLSYCWWLKSGEPVEVGSFSHYL